MCCLRMNNYIREGVSAHVTHANIGCINDDTGVAIIMVLNGLFV